VRSGKPGPFGLLCGCGAIRALLDGGGAAWLSKGDGRAREKMSASERLRRGSGVGNGGGRDEAFGERDWGRVGATMTR
jgi:hypothetical protein